jgi:D-alanine-D-alanine ligase
MTPNTYLSTFLRRARIAVVFGGTPVAGENAVHVTGRGRGKNYQAVAVDIANALVELGATFTNVKMLEDDIHLGRRLGELKIDLVWLNSGGCQGLGGMVHAAAVCEALGLAYIGHSPYVTALLDDKAAFKAVAALTGIKTAKFVVVPGGVTRDAGHFQRHFTCNPCDGPLVVKPTSGRASLNVEIAESIADVPRVVAEVAAATHGGAVLVEGYASGPEYAVGVMPGPWRSIGGVLHREARNAVVVSPIERIHGDGERIFASIDRRAPTDDRFRGVTGEIRALLFEMAMAVSERFELGTLVRLDVRTNELGELLVLEANPKPDLRRPADGVTSVTSCGLADQGMDYLDLIRTILANRLHVLQHQRPDLWAPIAAVIERGGE